MADFYERQQATALRLINLRGRTVQIRQKTVQGTSYDPTISYTDTPGKAIVGEALQSEIDGSKVRTGDKRFIFVSSITVTTNMFIVDGGVQYSLGKVKDTKPGDTSIVQTAWGRV